MKTLISFRCLIALCCRLSAVHPLTHKQQLSHDTVKHLKTKHTTIRQDEKKKEEEEIGKVGQQNISTTFQRIIAPK